VRLTLTDRVVRLVDEGVDVAVRIADLSDSALHAVRIAETGRVLVSSPAYLAARGEPRSLADLLGHDLIAFDNFTQNGEWRFANHEPAAIRFEPRLLTNSVQAALDAAIAGFGITRCLCYQIDEALKNGTLVKVLSAFEPPKVPVSLLFQANRRRSPNVRAFIAAMSAK
jgi:DNA-binding transcriptional LysR family regulator